MADNQSGLIFSVTAQREIHNMSPRRHTVQPVAIGGISYWLSCSRCGVEHGPFTLGWARQKTGGMVAALGGVVTWPDAKAGDDD